VTWTLVDDEPNINVRAIINPLTQVQELEALIAALIKRLPKEKPDDREPARLRGPDSTGGAGAAEKPKEARKPRELTNAEIVRLRAVQRRLSAARRPAKPTGAPRRIALRTGASTRSPPAERTRRRL
jgi:hypothetical protein